MASGVLGSMLSTGFQGLVGYDVGTVLVKNETEIKPSNSLCVGLTMARANRESGILPETTGWEPWSPDCR